MIDKAKSLYTEYVESYDTYSAPRQAALKARLTRYAKQAHKDSEVAYWLNLVADALAIKLTFQNDQAADLSPMMPPCWQVQLVRDPNSTGKSRQQITSQWDAIKILTQYLENMDREYFVVLMLDNKNRVIGLHTVSIGTINSTLVTARETFKAALLANAAVVILGHNHPSGDPAPSPEDIAITRRLVEAGKLLDIEVLDHIIVGDEGRSVSLKDRGLGFDK